MNVAVFASGGGSNFRAIHAKVLSGELSNVAVVLLVTNNSGCGAAAYAREHAIPVAHLSSRTDPDPAQCARRMQEVLSEHEVELIVLAGYMKLLPPEVVGTYAGRILNIHPALLPRFGGTGMYGIHVHEAVLAAGETRTGVTVHLVDEAYDQGRILEQVEVDVLPGDTPQTLQRRVLEVEHDVYWRVIDRLANAGETAGG